MPKTSPLTESLPQVRYTYDEARNEAVRLLREELDRQQLNMKQWAVLNKVKYSTLASFVAGAVLLPKFVVTLLEKLNVGVNYEIVNVYYLKLTKDQLLSKQKLTLTPGPVDQEDTPAL